MDAVVHLEVVCNLRGWLTSSSSPCGGGFKIRVRAVKYRLGQGSGAITAQTQVIKNIRPKPTFMYSGMFDCLHGELLSNNLSKICFLPHFFS